MKFVLLWTDLALWLMTAAVVAYALRVRLQAHLRTTWRRVLRDPVAASAGVVMALFLLVTLVDSVHLRRALPTAADADAVYDTRTQSLLDLLLERQIGMREVSYSVPLGAHGLNKESIVDTKGQVSRDYPRLQFGGAHLADPASQWSADIAGRAAAGLAAGIVTTLLLAGADGRRAGSQASRLAACAERSGRRPHLLPAAGRVLTLAAVLLLAGPVIALMPHYHVFGTDRTGNDVLCRRSRACARPS
jgi:peptide/nickel transport system permease protein